MRRRAQHRGPVEVPSWAARFDLAQWDDLLGEDFGPVASAARVAMARDRWREARDAWARANGWSWVDEIKACRDARRAGGRSAPPSSSACGEQAAGKAHT